MNVLAAFSVTWCSPGSGCQFSALEFLLSEQRWRGRTHLGLDWTPLVHHPSCSIIWWVQWACAKGCDSSKLCGFRLVLASTFVTEHNRNAVTIRMTSVLSVSYFCSFPSCSKLAGQEGLFRFRWPSLHPTDQWSTAEGASISNTDISLPDTESWERMDSRNETRICSEEFNHLQWLINLLLFLNNVLIMCLLSGGVDFSSDSQKHRRLFKFY